MRDVLPFILCGGAGTRLWPLSREAFPKQFHTLTGTQSLFHQTCRRLTGDLFGDLSILSNHQHRFLVQDQLQEIGIAHANILLEPVGRNAAPAACIAALTAGRVDPDVVVLLAPSDHAIGDDVAFADTVRHGIGPVRQGSIVTFGVRPDSPHTGYGYIETKKGEKGEDWVLAVERFVEKPSRERRRLMLIAVGSIGTLASFYLKRRLASVISNLRTGNPRRVSTSAKWRQRI